MLAELTNILDYFIVVVAVTIKNSLFELVKIYCQRNESTYTLNQETEPPRDSAVRPR